MTRKFMIKYKEYKKIIKEKNDKAEGRDVKKK